MQPYVYRHTSGLLVNSLLVIRTLTAAGSLSACHQREIQTTRPPTWVRPKSSHVTTVLGDSKLNPGGPGGAATIAAAPRGLSRSGQHARVLLVQQGDVEIGRISVVEPPDNYLCLGHQVQQGPLRKEWIGGWAGGWVPGRGKRRIEQQWGSENVDLNNGVERRGVPIGDRGGGSEWKPAPKQTGYSASRLTEGGTRFTSEGRGATESVHSARSSNDFNVPRDQTTTTRPTRPNPTTRKSTNTNTPAWHDLLRKVFTIPNRTGDTLALPTWFWTRYCSERETETCKS